MEGRNEPKTNEFRLAEEKWFTEELRRKGLTRVPSKWATCFRQLGQAGANLANYDVRRKNKSYFSNVSKNSSKIVRGLASQFLP